MSSFEAFLFDRKRLGIVEGDPIRFSTALVIGPGSMILAMLLLPLALFEYAEMTLPALLLSVLFGVAIVLAGYRPVAGWLAFLAGFLGSLVVIARWSPWSIAMMVSCLVVMFAIARQSGLRWAIPAWAATIASGMVTIQLGFFPFHKFQGLQVLIVVAVVSAISIPIGLMTRVSERAEADIRKESDQTSEERGQRKLLEEKARIAREMHDVVAHHMSVIAVQASTAEYRIDDLSDNAKREFTEIADTARNTLTEMRRLLAVLRQSGDAEVARAPQPGLESLAGLVDGAKRADITLDLKMPDDDLTAIPESVSLTAYRIVQEALSNVVRHAPGSKARVNVHVENDNLVVLVMNDAAPLRTEKTEGATTGHGITGMRERVALLKGDLITEDLGEAGYVVKARLPLTGVEAA